MAKQIVKEIECPSCKEKAELKMWDAINASLNSGLKEQVKTGKIFEWKCPHCGKTARIMYPILYIDMLNYFMVWFGAEGKCDPELYQSMDLENYQFRNARTVNELMEKIAILENGLDDHVLEIQKFSIVQAIYRQTEGGKKGPVPGLMLFRQMQDEDNILFTVFFQNAPAQMMRSSMNSYRQIEKDVSANPSLQKGLEDSKDKFQTVDFQWAKNAVQILGAQKQG
ncbi:MAG: hypothetical protein HFE44_07240 [Oscillospiraceae bacterium]|jgi:hypothetical protein|nr:hypothetical protein [Oscillospiraceae bacterium]